MERERIRRRPVARSDSSYTNNQASPGHFEMDPLAPADITDRHQHHSFEQSGYNSSQNSTYGILQDATPYTGAGNDGGEHQSADKETPGYISSRRPWNSSWLSAGTLIAFAALFLAFVAALVSIFAISERSDGFDAGTRSNRYAWKYVPTALIVIISALWGRIDYSSRLLSPWKNLKKGPASLDKSLLLDYVSMGPSIIVKSLVKRDWVVAVTSIGAILLKLAAVISTGLFSLRLTDIVAQDVPMVSLSTFSASGYNTSLSPLKAGSTLYGIQAYNLSYPDWTTDDMAIQPFEPLQWGVIPTNSTLSSEVPTFQPSFECVTADASVIFQAPVSNQDGRFNATVSTPNCKITIVSSAVDSTQANSYRGSSFPPVNYVSFQNVTTCENDGTERLVMAVSKADKTLHVDQISAILCRPTYRIQVAKVTSNLAVTGTRGSLSVKPIKDTVQSQLNGLNSTALYKAVLANLLSKPITSPPKTSEYFDTLFYPMGNLVGRGADNTTLGQFLNTTLMAETAAVIFKGVAAQIARQDFLQVGNSTYPGSISYQEYRLWANKISVVLLVAILVLLVLSSVLLQFLKPWNVVPRSPDTIFSTVAILSTSSDLKSSLEGTSFSRVSAIKSKLRQRSFQSRFTHSVNGVPGFQVDELSSSESVTRMEPESKSRALKPWRPFIVTIPGVLLVTVLPCIIIAVLQIIQSISDRSQGFLNVEDRTVNSYAMAFIPAIVVTLVSLMEDSLSSTSASIAAFWKLKAGNATASTTIFYNTVGDLFPVALYKSIKSRYWAIVFINIAAVLGTFLTIFTAELYSIEGVTRSSSITVNRVDGFNLTHTFRKLLNNDDGAGILTNLVLSSNLSYPAGTFDNLVFPTMNLSQVSVQSPNASAETVTAVVPALRAVLNCTITPPGPSNQGTTATISKLGDLRIQANFPNICPGEDGSLKRFNITLPSSLTSLSGTIASILDVNTVDSSTSDEVNVGLNKQSSVGWSDRPVGCPSLVTYLGTYELNTDKTLKKTDITVLVCTQLIQQVATNVTFSFQSSTLTIDPSNPPLPIESTATFLPNEFANPPSPIRQYQLQYGIYGLGKDYKNLGPFYDLAVQGQNGTPVADLLGKDHTANFFKATNRLYGQYMAQAISLNMRYSTPSILASSPPITDACIYRPASRIVQNQSPKLILQALLGVIVVCNVLTWCFMGRTKDLLYVPPSSILGTAGLFAGSEVWSKGFLPEGVAYSEKGEERVFDGWLFSLGWWGDGGEKVNLGREEAKRFGIDVGKAN